MPPRSGRSSEADYTGNNPYGDIPPDKPMTRAHAMECFNGPEQFSAFTDYWVIAKDDKGDIVSKAHTAVMSNHEPSETDQDAIEKYVSYANAPFDEDFLNSQMPRSVGLRTQSGDATDQDVTTYWGRVTPDTVFDLITEEHKRKWANMRAEDQSVAANNARALGAGASIGTQGGPIDPPEVKDRVIEFCGVTPCSFVEPAILQFMKPNGQIIDIASIRQYTNTIDPNANRTATRMLPRLGPDTADLQAFERSRDVMRSLNALRPPHSRFWVEVDHEGFRDLQNSDICNARLQGGLLGIYVSQDNTDGRFLARRAKITYSKTS
jgi:hypothetical protein